MTKGKMINMNIFDDAVPIMDSEKEPKGFKGIRGRIVSRLFNKLVGTVKSSDNYALPSPLKFVPHMETKRYSSTHYGIMIPDLPAPHFFMACVANLGGTGTTVFDIDHAFSEKHGPLGSSTLMHGTAEAIDNHFTQYSIPDDITANRDGSNITYDSNTGTSLEFRGNYPEYRISSRREDFSVDLTLQATGEITWFAYSKVYKHLSLLTHYEGFITSKGKTTSVKGLCTMEYATSWSPYRLINRPLPDMFKLPFNFFSYQVITLGKDTQICLTHCRVDNCNTLTAAYMREAGKGSFRIDGDVQFQVFSIQDESMIAPDGRKTHVPEYFRWIIPGIPEESVFEINAKIDTPMLYGLGTGWTGGYSWEGIRNGKAINGRGYIEYVDRREG